MSGHPNRKFVNTGIMLNDRVYRSVSLLSAVLLLACDSELATQITDGVEQAEDPRVGAVEILQWFHLVIGVARNSHTGDTIRLNAEVRDTKGNILTDRSVSWISLNTERATVTSGGLLTVGRTVVIVRDAWDEEETGDVTIVARVEGVADSITLDFNGWSLGSSTDPVTLRRTTEANLGALIGAVGPPRLHLRCEASRLDVWISVTFVTGSGYVEYRFNGQQPESDRWNEAQNFQAVFYPAQNDSAFARRLTQADSLLFRIDRFSGADVVATFVLVGADEVVPEIIDSCS